MYNKYQKLRSINSIYNVWKTTILIIGKTLRKIVELV